MRRLIRIWLLSGLLVGVLFGSIARAGFISFSCETKHLWDFDGVPVELNLWENIEVVGHDDVLMFGETDSDPTFHVTKTITNNSGLTWEAYELILSGAGVTFGTRDPTSNRFNTCDKDTLKLTFHSPDFVHDGESVTLGFDINVATWGLFSFTLTQNPQATSPIPEPATITLVGLAGAIMLRKRRG